MDIFLQLFNIYMLDSQDKVKMVQQCPMSKNELKNKYNIQIKQSTSKLNSQKTIDRNQMQQSATDIDRKLAIYYHPLFQQTITLLTDLFLKTYDDSTQLDPHSKSIKLNQEKPQHFTIGLLEFIQFNLKLQKSLLPAFEPQNAIISGLNDWVKEVAECLNFDGMVITTQCEQINEANFESLLRTEIISSKMQLYETPQKYIRTLSRLKNHDAFKLLGVKINKEVFSKFMFDLCSTWCEFLDIEMFVYFLTAIYLSVSEGPTFADSMFKSTHMVQTIDLEFMQQFQDIKQNYSKNKKKQLRYYRAWCEWNYLRVGEVGENLILCLDGILDDNRVLEIAYVFEKAIKVINEEITSQSQQQTPQDTIVLREKENAQNDFLIMKKLENKQNKNSIHVPPVAQIRQKSIEIVNQSKSMQNSLQQNSKKSKNSKALQKQKSIQRQRQGSIRIPSRNQTISEDQLDTKKNQQNPLESQRYANYPPELYDESYQHHDFQIQIDEFGNMYLKRVVKLPIMGQKIQPMQFDQKQQLQRKWIEKKSKQCRQISNLYRRLQNMKIRLQHNPTNDYYSYKKKSKIAERDKFYQKTALNKLNQTQIQARNNVRQQPVFQKSIHQKIRPEEVVEPEVKQDFVKTFAKPTGYFAMLKKQKQSDPIRKNSEYIHKVMAPSFLTDQKNNISYSQKQGSIYGVGAQDERRDIKLNLPKIKFMKDYKVKDQKSYHIIGKLTKDRTAINQRVKSVSMAEQNPKPVIRPLGIPSEQDKINNLKEESHHVWAKYINEEEITQLTNFVDFYQQLEKCKHKFSRQHESEYRKNLKPILVYQNKRYEMGGVITRKEEQRFYEKMKKLINRDQRRKKKKERKVRFRQYKKSFKNKRDRSFFEEVFINYHKEEISQIKEQRTRIKSQMVQMSSTTR